MSYKVIKLHEAMCYINEKILEKYETKENLRMKLREAICAICHTDLSTLACNKILIMPCSHVICSNCKDGCIKNSKEYVYEIKICRAPTAGISLDGNRIVRNELTTNEWVKTGRREPMFNCPLCRALTPESGCVKMNPSQL